MTITLGTNLLVGRDIAGLQTKARRILADEAKKSSLIPLWDGRAAERIANVILRGF